MEVDRISQMGGVGQESQPAWGRTRAKRRRFVEEMPEDETEEMAEESEPGAEEEKSEGGLDVMA